MNNTIQQKSFGSTRATDIIVWVQKFDIVFMLPHPSSANLGMTPTLTALTYIQMGESIGKGFWIIPLSTLIYSKT